jgi:hypothetical protein
VTSPEPIEEYLDTLYLSLKGNPRQARRLLAEAEAHLRDAADAATAGGLDPLEAERAAVANFGPPTGVVPRPGVPAILGDLTYLGVKLGAIGLVAVGLSGLVALVMNLAFGRSFVGNGAGNYSAADCQRYLAIWPHATSCAQAAMFEGSSDAVSLRVAAGLVGALVLVALRFWRRPARTTPTLPAAIAPTIAATAFGGAAAWLLG